MTRTPAELLNWNRLDWNALDAAQREQVLRRPAQVTQAATAATVATILDEVRRDGDAAVRACTRRFDGIEQNDLAVDADEFRAAESGLPQSLRDAIDEAAARIASFPTTSNCLRNSVVPSIRCDSSAHLTTAT